MSNVHIRLASLLICATSILCAAEQGGETNYADGRPAATLRYDALDQGIVLPFGGCPKNCDKYGARDVWVLAHKGKFYMHYDAAGEAGWLAALAVSSDLEHWKKLGTVLELGPPGSRDLWHNVFRWSQLVYVLFGNALVYVLLGQAACHTGP
jgi:hypothetical protein